MSVNYTVYAQHANATITVSNSSELNAALANLGTSGGGTILLDGNGGPYDISANGVGNANNPVLLKAADPSNEPLVQGIYLQNSSHITMTQLDVNSVGTGSTVQDLRISNSDHIEFVDNSMTSDANGMLGSSSGVNQGGKAVLVRNSQDIVFNNNTITDYQFGAAFLETVGLDFSNNEVTGIQGDGFRAGGIQNATINNNYMHDFYGSTQTITHNDFIQFWSVNATIVTGNIEISNNVLDANGGGSAQGIFVGNEGTRHGANGPLYNDIRIHDNVVHTASYNGISVGGTNNAQVYNNTVLFDDQAQLYTSAGAANTPHEPFIRLTGSAGAVVYGNISGKVNINGILDTGTNNQILDYKDSATTSYVDNYMANLPQWSGGSTGGGTTSGPTTGGGSTGSTGTTGGTDTSGSTGSTDTSGGSTTDSSGGSSGGTGTTDTTNGTPDTSSGEESDGNDTSDQDTTENETKDLPDNASVNAHAIGAIFDKSISNLLSKFAMAPGASKKALTEETDQTEQPMITLDDILATLNTEQKFECSDEDEPEKELELELI